MNSPDAMIAACTASHRRLEAAIVAVTDDRARQASLLPGWTIGHVLTHVARHADSHARMLGGAERGGLLNQYVGGAVGRQTDIETGAFRPANELIDDVVAADARLEAAWAATTDRGWAGHGLSLAGEISTVVMPSRRLMESEMHHIDLGLIGNHEYTFADLSNDFVGLETRRLTALWASRQPMGLTSLSPVALGLSPPERLAWLVGRIQVGGLAPAGVFW